MLFTSRNCATRNGLTNSIRLVKNYPYPTSLSIPFSADSRQRTAPEIHARERKADALPPATNICPMWDFRILLDELKVKGKLGYIIYTPYSVVKWGIKYSAHAIQQKQQKQSRTRRITPATPPPTAPPRIARFILGRNWKDGDVSVLEEELAEEVDVGVGEGDTPCGSYRASKKSSIPDANFCLKVNHGFGNRGLGPVQRRGASGRCDSSVPCVQLYTTIGNAKKVAVSLANGWWVPRQG
ncbi:hypothetical protein FH972_024626 [Carpinus fangiana]|uniref:Uncharacterized protein n=1 Tax=Carpinus fangiana TaxID=176857 RepID=A0A5N6KZ83_9ROSI|nr:hypothetical protein FH972_024626 [Carpinus fangiana]